MCRIVSYSLWLTLHHYNSLKENIKIMENHPINTDYPGYIRLLHQVYH